MSGTDQFAEMSMEQLKAFLESNGIQAEHCVEREDFINEIKAHGFGFPEEKVQQENAVIIHSTPSPAPQRNPLETQIEEQLLAARLWQDRGHLPNAIVHYEAALSLDRSNESIMRALAIACSDLGSAVRGEDRKEEGKAWYYRALAADCKYPAAWYNLGVCYAEERKMDQAQVHYQMCIHFDPVYAEAHNNLGAHYKDLGQNDKAIWHYKEAARSKPTFCLPLSNLASLYHGMGRVELAQEAGETAIRIDPNFAEAHNNLGSVYLDQGLSEKAVASFQRCLDLDPHNERLKADNNKLLALNYLLPNCPSDAPEESKESVDAVNQLNNEIGEAHKAYGRKFGRKYPPYTHWPNLRTFDRPIRVGFLSSDFKTHSVSFFAEAPLRYLNQREIEFYCYFQGPGDTKTEMVFKRICDPKRWRNLEYVNLETICNTIRADKIDILVELGGHSAGSRLDVMARKPAPIGVTWIGYANSTGLTTVDYRITDSIADPYNTKQTYTEQLVRMPDPFCFLCYTPNMDVPPVSPLPALSKGYITFGSFNALGKINDQVLELWCRVLNAIPTSRFFMKCKHFASDELSQRFINKFKQHGIDVSRLTLLPMTPTIAQHMALYSQIDIAVDSFPYAGTTTTAESLYMGVPVVTWYRKTAPIHAQNVGASLMARIPGMSEAFVATSKQGYVDLCVKWANDIPALAQIRENLRPSMLVSPLCDGPAFAKKLEKVFRDMWEAYCKGKKMTY